MIAPIPPPAKPQAGSSAVCESSREDFPSGTDEPSSTGGCGVFFCAENYEPQDSLLYLLRKAMIAVGQAVNEKTDLGGTTVPQWVPLYKVHLGHADTVAELARQCTLDTGAMTRLLDRLETKGLCRRERSESDRRVVHIKLTSEGVAAAEQVPVVLSRVYNEALEGFSDAEWQQFQHLLKRLITSAERLSGKAAKESAE